MTRFSIFILLRLVALLWVLALSNLASALGPYGVSLCVIVSEVLLGYAWGKVESRVTFCMPKTPDLHRLFLLMAGVAIVETAAVILFVGVYVPWLVLWRVITAYLPFTMTEVFVFRKMCKVKGLRF